MSESIKAVCTLLAFVATVVSATAWLLDRPDADTWCMRIGGLVTAVLAIGVILALRSRADLVPDYLRSLAGTYFNRDGFCFTARVTAVDGTAFVEAHFQTQHDKPSIGRIALRPGRGFFLTRANIDAVTFEIECPPGGFGVARVAIPIPKQLQGKRQSFEVGASVHYPAGKGRRIRFHDGIFLRTNSNFGNAFGKTLTVAGAAMGSIVLSTPASMTIDLPSDVSQDTPIFGAQQTKILWQLGDTPLDGK